MINTQLRTHSSIRNTLFAAIAYITKMLLQFAVRFIFIRYFVAGYLGINGLFTNMLNVLSLAELGIGNAIVYSMYKPVAENNVEKIKSLVRLYRNLYIIIACVVTIIGLALIPALPYLITDVPDVDINLIIVYLLYLAQTVVGYFFAYRRSLVFVYQRNDIESKVSIVVQILLVVAQILIIVLWTNFYAYTVAIVICSALDAIIVFAISYKLFPDIRGKTTKLEKSDIKEISKNTGAMVLHKIGGAAVFSTDSIIISAFISTAILGYYSNYVLITTALASMLNIINTALRGSIGNFIAEKTPAETYTVFNALNLGYMWVVGFMFIGLFVCFQDFIKLYSGKEEYVLNFSTMALICISFYFTQSRWMTDSFKECAGLFWNNRYMPLFEVPLNLGLDILLVHFWGINGVIIATIISTVTIAVWVEPYVLYKNYFKQSLGRYFTRYLVYTLITVLAGGITYGVCYFIPTAGVWWFLLRFIICIILPNALYFVIYFKTSEFKYLLGVVETLFKNRKGQAIGGEIEQDNIADKKENTKINQTDNNSEQNHID